MKAFKSSKRNNGLLNSTERTTNLENILNSKIGCGCRVNMLFYFLFFPEKIKVKVKSIGKIICSFSQNREKRKKKARLAFSYTCSECLIYISCKNMFTIAIFFS